MKASFVRLLLSWLRFRLARSTMTSVERTWQLGQTRLFTESLRRLMPSCRLLSVTRGRSSWRWYQCCQIWRSHIKSRGTHGHNGLCCFSLSFYSNIPVIKLATAWKLTCFQVMGRHCGYLALVAGVVTEADFVFVPEVCSKISKKENMIRNWLNF